jgi:SAM-dependent methyltransferase
VSGESYVDYERWKGWAPAEFGKFTASDAAYFQAELTRAGMRPKVRYRILELGFGNGTFAGWALERGHEYLGTEVIAELLGRAREAGLQVWDAEEDLERWVGPGTLDLVVAWDVLEHRERDALENDLRVLLRLLRPDGRLVARVPSGDSPFGRSVHHGDLTHKLALGTSAIHQLAVRCGFEVLTVGPPMLPVRGVGLRRVIRRALLRAARSVTARFINAVFHDNQPRVITSNLVFVLRRPAGSSEAARD